jgi:hypothetical protein
MHKRDTVESTAVPLSRDLFSGNAAGHATKAIAFIHLHKERHHRGANPILVHYLYLTISRVARMTGRRYFYDTREPATALA